MLSYRNASPVSPLHKEALTSCLNLSRPLNRTLRIGWLLTLNMVLGGCVSVNDFKGGHGEAEALKQHLREMELLTKGLGTGSRPPSQNFGESYRQP